VANHSQPLPRQTIEAAIEPVRTVVSFPWVKHAQNETYYSFHAVLHEMSMHETMLFGEFFNFNCNHTKSRKIIYTTKMHNDV
jgi:hypothetical protein